MNITIVGPRSVGKTTICNKLAPKIRFNHISTDILLDKELQDVGGLSKALVDNRGPLILERGIKVKSKALDKDKVLLDLAGGSINNKQNELTHYKEEMRKIISKKSVVVGLLPFEDDRKSIDFLFSREKTRKHFLDMNPSELYKKVEKDYLAVKEPLIEIADILIWINGRETDEVVDEIVDSLDI